MKKDKFLNNSVSFLYKNLLNNFNEMMSDVDVLIEKIQSSNKDKREADEQVAIVLLNSYNMAKHIVAENGILYDIVKELTNTSIGNSTAEIRFKVEDIISEEDFEDIFGDRIPIDKITIPIIKTFDAITVNVQKLLTETITFILMLLVEEVTLRPTQSEEEILSALNSNIEKYIGIYEDLKILVMIKPDEEDKILTIPFDENDKEEPKFLN